MAGQVLVLNASYEPINVCSLQRAVVLVLKDKAEVIEQGARRLRSATASFALPLVIRLVYYVRVPLNRSRRVSRRALFARDGFVCQYCGSRHELTIDHVLPRSRGGESTWENTVTCCSSCNLQKADRTPEEADMVTERAPRPPGPAIFITAAAGGRPPSWERYLSTL